MATFSCCTIVARNYLPRARVLAGSLRRHHPDVTLWVLVIDAESTEWADEEPFSGLSLDDVGLGGLLGREMAAVYSILEFSTSVKPWLLTHLLERTGAPVLYFDPDIEIFSPVGHLAELTAEHGVALTPHHLKPVPRDGRTPTEADYLAAGVYNLGFIGTGVGALDSGFLEFWRERLRRDGLVDYAHMMHTDQRWVDFIDCFPYHVVRDPGCNVAYWNIGQRSLSRASEAISVDGSPLVFFHFSGFDPARPHLLSVNQGERPRIFLSEHRIVADLCAHYLAAVVAEGYFEDLATPYGWRATPAGLTMTPVLRRAYRQGLIEADRTGSSPPPNPFDRPGEFEAWIDEAEMGATGLPVYLYSLWGLHPDLQASFVDPLINPLSAHAFFLWALDDADPRRNDLPGGLRAHLAARVAERNGTGPDAPGDRPVRPGLNVMGYLNAELGVGQAARLLLGAADAAGVPTSTLPWDPEHGLVDRLPAAGSGEAWSFDTNVFCINADMIGTVRAGLPVSMFHRRATAGVWFWEAERFPDRLLYAFDLVDEVWAPSRFIADSLERTGRATVVPIRMPVPVPTWSTSLTRSDLGLPEGFLVLFAFDFASVFDRKNPLGLIDAYCQAFGPDDGAHLVLKTVGGARHWEQMELLRASIHRPDVLVMDGFVRPHQVKAMLELSDCYASLHRSEGFGLGLAEAMALGKPVVATAWSGNMEFMDAENSYLVPAELVPIPDDVHVYGGLGRWAEPDLEAAADALRAIHDDPSGAAALGRRARDHMARTRDPRAVGEQLAACAERLRRSRWPRRLSA
jgi:glycosyltransferase involved in cell wall biosynthesis